MSDQPTTGEQRTQCPCCGQIIPTQKELTQPKPTTGEWTLDGCCIRVQDGAIICVNSATTATTLRQYHNAALDAEREKQDGIVLKQGAAIEARNCEITQLRKELAEEREKVRQGLECITTRTRERDSCKEQLSRCKNVDRGI